MIRFLCIALCAIGLIGMLTSDTYAQQCGGTNCSAFNASIGQRALPAQTRLPQAQLPATVQPEVLRQQQQAPMQQPNGLQSAPLEAQSRRISVSQDAIAYIMPPKPITVDTNAAVAYLARK